MQHPICQIAGHLVGAAGWDWEEERDARLGRVVAYGTNPTRPLGTIIDAPKPGVVEVMIWDFDRVDEPTRLVKWGDLVILGSEGSVE